MEFLMNSGHFYYVKDQLIKINWSLLFPNTFVQLW